MLFVVSDEISYYMKLWEQINNEGFFKVTKSLLTISPAFVLIYFLDNNSWNKVESQNNFYFHFHGC